MATSGENIQSFLSRLLTMSIDDVGRSEIEEILSLQIEEGQQVEFKREPPPNWNDAAKREFRKDVVAMANGGGGIIVYGVNEDGHGRPVSLVPASDSYSSDEIMSSLIVDKIEPRLQDAVVRRIGLSSGDIIVVRIGAPSRRPVCVLEGERRAFPVRQDRLTRPMTYEEIQSEFQDGKALREIAALRGFMERNLQSPSPQDALPASTQISLLEYTDGEALARRLLDDFVETHRDRPLFRLACVPANLRADRPLLRKKVVVQEHLQNPPGLNQNNWFIESGTPVKRFELGLEAIHPFHGQRLQVYWNGASVFSISLDTDYAKWAMGDATAQHGVPLNPLSYIEPIVRMFELQRVLLPLMGYSGEVIVNCDFVNAEEVWLTRYEPGSMGLRMGHAEIVPNVIVKIDKQRLSVFMHPTPAEGLNGTAAKRLLLDLYELAGIRDGGFVPFFDGDQ